MEREMEIIIVSIVVAFIPVWALFLFNLEKYGKDYATQLTRPVTMLDVVRIGFGEKNPKEEVKC